MCREAYKKYGMSLRDRIHKLHWMVRVVVHIQQILKARNVRYEPYGPWDHFLGTIYGQPKATKRRTNLGSSSSSSSSSSGSSLVSKDEEEDVDENEEE